jgi:hypothetical protein
MAVQAASFARPANCIGEMHQIEHIIDVLSIADCREFWKFDLHA